MGLQYLEESFDIFLGAMIMTIKTFYNKLEKCSGQFNWKVCRDGSIRGYLKNKPANSRYCFCPVTAVNYSMTGIRIHVQDVRYCGFLESEDRGKIKRAADNEPNAIAATRKTLLRRVGLV